MIFHKNTHIENIAKFNDTTQEKTFLKDKIKEETEELQIALHRNIDEEIAEEIADVLIVLYQIMHNDKEMEIQIHDQVFTKIERTKRKYNID